MFKRGGKKREIITVDRCPWSCLATIFANTFFQKGTVCISSCASLGPVLWPHRPKAGALGWESPSQLGCHESPQQATILHRQGGGYGQIVSSLNGHASQQSWPKASQMSRCGIWGGPCSALAGAHKCTSLSVCSVCLLASPLSYTAPRITAIMTLWLECSLWNQSVSGFKSQLLYFSTEPFV